MKNSGKIIDITLALSEPMRGFQKKVAKSIEKDGWNAYELNIYSHAGTHMDAPIHFDVNDQGIDEINPERFICNCHIIRLTDIQPSELIDIDSVASIKNKIKKGEGIIFHTGWSKHVENMDLYRNKLPRISEKLAILLAEKEINLLGVEPPSIADVNKLEELQTVHRILLQASVLIVEGLCNLESVKNDYVKLIALPLKIEKGDGAPIRALIIDK